MFFNSQLRVLFYSFRYKHYLIYVSTLTASVILFLQPLVGSLLQIRQVPYTFGQTSRLHWRAALLIMQQILRLLALALWYFLLMFYNWTLF